MEVPQLTGEALALYGFIQAQLQEVHNTMTAMAADIAAAAVNQETQNRFATIDQGMNAASQRIEQASQTWEARFGTLTNLVTAMGAGGTGRRKVDITESKPVNNMKEFGGGDREQFREWAKEISGFVTKAQAGSEDDIEGD